LLTTTYAYPGILGVEITGHSHFSLKPKTLPNRPDSAVVSSGRTQIFDNRILHERSEKYAAVPKIGARAPLSAADRRVVPVPANSGMGDKNNFEHSNPGSY
jgi:hypothetical protein